MNVPLTWLICGSQVYCLIEIINLLMGASLLALAKSLYYRRAYKQASPTQRFLPGEPLSSPQSSRRLVMTAPPQKTFPEFAQVGLHASGSSGDWTVHIATSQFFTLYCTTTISLTFTQLHKPIFSRPWKVYLVLLFHYSQDFCYNSM